MHPRYYGDTHDLHKWTTLLRLADETRANILYFAMVTTHEPPREFDSRAWAHFRDLSQITALDSRIEFFSETFEHRTREHYFEAVCSALRNSRRPVIAFLDPDTGVASNSPSDCHVTVSEIKAVWNCLNPKDSLVVYQHNDHSKDWLFKKGGILKEFLGVECLTQGFGNAGFLLCRK